MNPEWRKRIERLEHLVQLALGGGGGGGGGGITQLTQDVIAGPGSGSQIATVEGIQTDPIITSPPYTVSEVPVADGAGHFVIRQLTADDIGAGFSITAFNGGWTIEIGATETNPAFTASYSSLPTSAAITNTDGTGSPLNLTTPFTSGTVVGSFTHNTASNVTFTLTAHQNSLVKTATATGSWVPRSFGGIGTPGATTSTASGNNAVLNGGAGTLTDTILVGNVVGQTFGPFSPVSQVIYLQLPAGAHTFVDGSGFPFVMTAVNTFTFVNQFGQNVSETLWASNTLSSPFSVKVAT